MRLMFRRSIVDDWSCGEMTSPVPCMNTEGAMHPDGKVNTECTWLAGKFSACEPNVITVALFNRCADELEFLTAR